MKHCPQCSREYPDSSKFCTNCGRPLADGPVGPATEPTAPEEPSAPAAGLTTPEEPPAPAAEPTAPEEPPAPAAEPTTREAPSAPAVIEEISVVAAVPAVIEIPIYAPEPPAAVGEEPEAPAPAEEPLRGGGNIGFFRKTGAVFLCVLLFLFLLLPMAAYQVRDASTRAWISRFLEKVSMSDLGDLDEIEDAVGGWIQGLDPELEDVELDMGGGRSDIDSFLDRVKAREFVARRLASYFGDLYSGASGTAFAAEDVSELVAENSEAINDQLNEMADDLFGSRSEVKIRLTRADRNDLAERLIGLLEDAGAAGWLDTDTMKAEMPAVYYGLRFGFSYITAGASLVLAAAVFICLCKTLKSGLRAANRAGIVLIVLGGLLTPAALFPKLFADLWLGLFEDARVLAIFAEEFLYTHILADLIVLATGILLTVATGLALNLQKRRAAQAVARARAATPYGTNSKGLV